MGETMRSKIYAAAKSKPVRCKLQYAKPGQKSDGAITTFVVPSVDEDKNRGHSGDTDIMTADKAFNRQNYDYHNIDVIGVLLDKDNASPAKQFRAAFADKNIQKGLANFLVEIGRPGALHNPLAPKIDAAFAGKYSFLAQEKSEIKIKYQLQKDGSVIVINEFSAAYIENKKMQTYVDYDLDINDSTVPVDQKVAKPQINLVYARIVHKIEMKNDKPQVSIIERQFSVESENVKEASAMGRLLAKKMGLASNPIVNLLSSAFRYVKNLVLKARIEEPTTAKKEKGAADPAFFGSTQRDWSLSQVRQPAKTVERVMSASEAYKGAGLFGGHPAPIDPIAAIQSSVQQHLDK